MSEPVYTIHSQDLMIRIDAPADLVIRRNERTNISINIPLNFSETDKRILKLVVEDPTIAMWQIVDAMGTHRKTVGRHVQVREEQKLLERTDSRKKGTWRVYVDV